MVMLSSNMQFSTQPIKNTSEKKVDTQQTMHTDSVNVDFEQLLKKETASSQGVLPSHNHNAVSNTGVNIAVIDSVAASQAVIRLLATGQLVAADSMVALSTADIGAQCAIMYKLGDTNQPMIMGLLNESVTVIDETLVDRTQINNDSDTQHLSMQANENGKTDVSIDELAESLRDNEADTTGSDYDNYDSTEYDDSDYDHTDYEIPDTLHIQANEQLTLQCGDAILYMDATGHVEIRSSRMISHSTGLNRIRGASVKIN